MIESHLPRVPLAIVTGAASGLGRAISLQLAQQGYHVVVSDIDLPGAQRVAAELIAQHGHACAMRLDVTSAAGWSALRDDLQLRYDHLDLLVNNAGIGCAGEIGQFSLDDWQAVVDVNFRGAVNGCHAMIDWLKANPRGGHIVNVASIAAVASGPTLAAYNATKAAVLSLSETLYVELKRHNIGVTVVCPGFFPTNILSNGRFSNQAQRSAAEVYMRQATITAEQVAVAVVRAVERKRLYVILPLRARIVWWLKRLAPHALLSIVAWHYGKSVRARVPATPAAPTPKHLAVKEESRC
jgi:NADP-dependent 3-hydroxy acid dehydrogenase YdfG